MNKDIKIKEVKLSDNATITVMYYNGEDDPVRHIDQCLKQYTTDKKYVSEFIDINCDNPWVRILLMSNTPIHDMMSSSTEKLIYVVECHSGEFDDHHSWVAGVYDNNEQAEALALELDNKVKSIKDQYEAMGGHDTMAEQGRSEEYFDFIYQNERLISFRCYIQIYPLNTPLEI